MEKKLKGYCITCGNVDYFIVTDVQRKTEKFCEKVEAKLQEAGCTRVRRGKYYGYFGDFSIHDCLQAGTCELQHYERGDYYDIKGEGWSRGAFVSENRVKIINL